MKRRPLTALLATAFILGCADSREFTDADWTDYFEFCVEHDPQPSRCGHHTDVVRGASAGRDADCIIRIGKRHFVEALDEAAIRIMLLEC